MDLRRKIVDSLMMNENGFEHRYNVGLQIADMDHDNGFALAIFQQANNVVVDADYPLRT